MSEVVLSREEFDALRAEVDDLKRQLMALKAAQFKDDPEVTEETLHVIAAVVAAYLGKHATIRFIRKATAENEGWRVQGRAAVQASHAMPRTRAMSS
jgi:hypothetical protein